MTVGGSQNCMEIIRSRWHFLLAFIMFYGFIVEYFMKPYAKVDVMKVTVLFFVMIPFSHQTLTVLTKEMEARFKFNNVTNILCFVLALVGLGFLRVLFFRTVLFVAVLVSLALLTSVSKISTVKISGNSSV